MKKFGRSIKAVAYAVALLASVGAATEAKAFSFNNGDLVVGLYGNSNEYLFNLGQASTLLAPGASTNINLTGSSAAGGTSPVQFSLVEYFINGDSTVINSIVSSAPQLSDYSAADLATSDAASVLNLAVAWQGTANTISGDTISAADSSTWTSNFGTDQMNGAWARSTRGVFGSTLYLLSGDFFTGEKSLIGTAFLNGDGSILTIAGLGGVPEVPIPAAVILFGTGLAGLVGVARRKMVAA